MNVLVFDIETVPDVDAGRRLHGLNGLSDKEVADVMFHLRRQETGGSDFLRLHMQRIVAISAVLRRRDAQGRADAKGSASVAGERSEGSRMPGATDTVKVWSLGEPDAPEQELVQRFFDGIERFSPTLVSWNGGGFDLPVLHYRALVHGVVGRRYWDAGDDDRDFRWNNYLSRYHARHTDLMDVLSAYQSRATAPLDQVATLLGFPGKMGMSGALVWENYLNGNIAGIRNYCETDVLNTYLVYLRFELIRGHLSAEDYQAECQLLRETLTKDNKPHLNEFLQAWIS